MGNYIPFFGRRSKKLDEEGESTESSDDEGESSTVAKGISKFEAGESSEASKSDKSKDKKKKKKAKKKNSKKDKSKTKEEEKKEKDSPKKKKKDTGKKGSKKSKGSKKLENESDDETKPAITTEKKVKDIKNLSGDPGKSSDATTIEVNVGKGDMRGKENTMPGPGVSALAEKFGGKTTGAQKRGRASPETPKASEPHDPVHSKKFDYDRLKETPKKNGEPTEGAVDALKAKFGGDKGTPKKTPSKASGAANKWQPKKKYSSLKDSGSNSDSDVEQSTTTTKSTPGTRALRDKFNNNTEDKKSAGDTTKSPDKKRRLIDEASSEENVQKENEKNKSTRKAWSPSKKGSEGTKDDTPRKRKSGLGSTKSKTTKSDTSVAVKRRNFENKHEPMDEKFEELILRRTSALIYGADMDPLPTRTFSSTPIKTETKEPMTKRTLEIETPKELPKTKPEPKETVTKKSRLEETPKQEAKEEINNFVALQMELEISVKKRRKPEDSPKQRPKTEHMSAQSTTKAQYEVTKRSKVEDSPKQRPKTEYGKAQTSETPRPRSVANTREMFASPSSNFNGTTPGVNKTPKTNKEKLLVWCQQNTAGYEGVNVRNFSSSWADGLAFCALVHHFYPNAFNFNSLKASNKEHNLKLAFDSAEKHAGVPQLLEVNDMLDMGSSPDWKCVFTYMTSLYQGLNRNAK